MKSGFLRFVVPGFLLLASAFAIYFLFIKQVFESRDKECGMELYYPIGSEKLNFVKCGYVDIDNESMDYYFGKAEEVFVRDEKVLIRLNLGNKSEVFVLGFYNRDWKVEVTEVVEKYPLPHISMEESKQALLNLDEGGLVELQSIVGRYVVFGVWKNISKLEEMRSVYGNSIPKKELELLSKMIDDVGRCFMRYNNLKMYYIDGSILEHLKYKVSLCNLWIQKINVLNN